MTKLQMTIAGAVLVAAVATPLALQQQSLNRLRSETAQLRQENESLQSQSAQVAALIAENQRLSNRVAQATSAAPPRQPEQSSELLRLRNQITRLQSDARTAKSSNAMVEMLKSPEMKEMMKATFASMAEKTYGKFFATANLSPEQISALKDLLVNRQLVSLDTGLSLYSPETDPAKRQAQFEQVKRDTDAVDEQIKQLLGPETYARFQEYDKTQTERMTINSFKDESPAGAAITPAQEEQLVAAMKEERESFKFAIDPKDPTKAPGDMASAFTPEKMQLYRQELDRLNQRYLARAKDILSPEQLDAFGKFLTKQQQAGLASMQMSMKLLAPK